jgi:hypothetical protein
VYFLLPGQYVKLKNITVPTEEVCGNLIQYVRLYRVTTGDNGNKSWDMVHASVDDVGGT